jgi:hypothetical protein
MRYGIAISARTEFLRMTVATIGGMMRFLARRLLLAGLAAILLSPLSWAAEPSLEFIHITDSHVMDLTGVHPELANMRKHYAHSADTLPEFLGRKTPAAFVLATGDLIDAFCFEGAKGGDVCGQLDRFKSIYGHSRVPVYLTLGNHDVQRYRYSAAPPSLVSDRSIAAEARAAWRSNFKCFRKGTYYSFRKKAGKTSYLFVILDNGDTRDAAFTSAQLQWLNKQISSNRDHAVILATHIPLGDNAFSKAVKSAIAKLHQPVLALVGHRHTDAVEETAAGGRSFVQVRTAIFARAGRGGRVIRLLKDRIEVCATGDAARIVRTISVPYPVPVVVTDVRLRSTPGPPSRDRRPDSAMASRRPPAPATVSASSAILRPAAALP